MDSRDLVVIAMCLTIILIGVIVFRVSPRDRGMGIIGIVLGTVALITYLTGGNDAPTGTEATPGTSGVASPAALIDTTRPPGGQ